MYKPKLSEENRVTIPVNTIVTASPNLRRRLIEQEEAVSDILVEEGRRWSVLSGEYSGISVVPGMERDGDLEGIEVTLSIAIQQALQQPKDDRKPILAIDVGGGFGTTWIKLAKRFKPYVHSGKLAMVVTNLEGGFETLEKFSLAKIETFPGGAIAERYFSLYTNSLDAYAKELVYFVQSDAYGLFTGGVNSKRGYVPFWNNASVVFESFSISHHTFTPEVDVPYIVGAINNKGMYFTVGDPYKGDNSLPTQTFESLQNRQFIRVNKVEIGPHADTLVNSGLLIAKGPKSDIPLYA